MHGKNHIIFKRYSKCFQISRAGVAQISVSRIIMPYWINFDPTFRRVTGFPSCRRCGDSEENE